LILVEEVEGRTRGVGARVEFLGILQVEVQKAMDAASNGYVAFRTLDADVHLVGECERERGEMASACRAGGAAVRCACNQRRLSGPLVPIAFGGRDSSTFRKKKLVASRPLLAVLARFLFGPIPAGKELLRCLLVAPLHFPHARNVVGVLVPVPK
jgi:hypothetical protein